MKVSYKAKKKEFFFLRVLFLAALHNSHILTSNHISRRV